MRCGCHGLRPLPTFEKVCSRHPIGAVAALRNPHCVQARSRAKVGGPAQRQSGALAPAGGTVTRLAREVASTVLPGAAFSTSSSSNV